MKTTAYTFYEQIILENIDLEAYGIDTSNMKEFDKVAEIYTIFTGEYLHHNNRNKDVKILFKDWLQGLPTVLTIPFMNHNIIKSAENSGFEFMNENIEDAFLESYWQNCANAFFTLYENL